MEQKRTQPSAFFARYNINPWKKNLPDCAIRSTALAINIPYLDVCRTLGVSFKNGHGLIRNGGIYLQKIKDAFDDYFDVVVDFSEELPPDALPDGVEDTTELFQDNDEIDSSSENSEINLEEWMRLNAGTGIYIVSLHNPSSFYGGHLVCVSTNAMKFFDTWDCSKWKVDAWLRVNKRN